MKLICSSRNDRIGVGSLIILEVTDMSSVVFTDDTIKVLDVSGVEFEVYDYILIQDLIGS